MLEISLAGLHGAGVRAGLLHEPRQGGGLQAHPGLLPEQRRRGRRPGRHDRRTRRLRPADRVRRAERPDRHLDQLLHAAVRPRRPARSCGCISPSAPWSGASRARLSPELPELPEMQTIHGPKQVGRPRREGDRGLAAGRPVVLDREGPCHRAPQPLHLDPVPAAVLRGLDGVVGGRREAAGGRLQVLDRSVVLACRAARHCQARRLRIFYSFLPPILGGRLWTTIVDLVAACCRPSASGYAVQDPNTPYSCSWRWRCSAASAAATSPRRWPTSPSSSPRRRRATRSRSTPGSAISASASCSSSSRS